MVEETRSTRVEIFDQTYHIRGAIDSGYVETLANYVDRKMREIAETSRTVDTVKVAVMAAINIADELFQERDEAQRVDSIIHERSTQCARLIDQVLKR